MVSYIKTLYPWISTADATVKANEYLDQYKKGLDNAVGNAKNENLVDNVQAATAIAGAVATTKASATPTKWNGSEKVQNKIPNGWGNGTPNKKGEGWRWSDGKGNGVRVDKGDPNSINPSQRVDHVVINSNGKIIGRDGNPISGSIKSDPVNAHIPLSEYLKWGSWNKP